MNRAIILASGSPRRRELLAQAGVKFIVDAANVDESFEGGPEETVLAADTIVYCAGRVLGKPAGREEARAMLRGLSDGWHEVYTGVSVAKDGKIESRCDKTRVHFVFITDDQIDAYVATGEPMDKAGAYAIQGGAARFIDRI